MTQSPAEKLLDPMGEPLQTIARGRRGAGRLEVSLLWPQIAKALDAGATVTMVWEALSKQGLVSIKLRGFTREVQGRRKGARGSVLAAKPATETSPSTEDVSADDSARPDAPAVAGATRPPSPETKPGVPDRPWRKGPRVPPDPNFVFTPRDPLADD